LPIGGNASEDCSAATQYGSFKTKRSNRNVIALLPNPRPQPGNLSVLKWLCNREIYVASFWIRTGLIVNPDPDPDPCFVITTKVEFIQFFVLFFKFSSFRSFKQK
jgi:hypothetical protein